MTAAPTQFGALPLPVPAPAAEAAVSDPGLDVLLAFAKDVLVARCNTAWAAIAPNIGNGDVVQLVRTHDPAERAFLEKQLPALWGWRTKGDSETIADDFDTSLDTLCLLWVFPPALAENQRLRGPIVNGVAKSLLASLKRGRDPAWVKSGDTEPQAAANGSFLWSWAGWFALEGKPSWKLQELVVEKGESKASYPAVQFELQVRELVHLGLPPDPSKTTTTLVIPLPDEQGGDHTMLEFQEPL